MTDYVTVAEALAIHADQIERYGGSAGVRDFGLLEAALFRPQTGYYPGLIEEPLLCGKAFRKTIHSWMATSEQPSPLPIRSSRSMALGSRRARAKPRISCSVSMQPEHSISRLSLWLHDNVAFDAGD
jgi:hypothetical protein